MANTITRVNYYTISGRWYYSAWISTTEHDHNGECDDCESAAEARDWLAAQFPGATIIVASRRVRSLAGR